MYPLISIKISLLIIAISSLVSVDCSKSSSSTSSCQVSRGNGLIDSSEQLREALQSARPGTVIKLAAVDFDGSFQTNNGGSSDQKIVLKGTSECSRHTKIRGELTLNGANNFVVKSLVFQGSKNALTINNANNVVVESVIINSISGDAIRITGASNNIKLVSNIIEDIKGIGIAIEGTSQPVYLKSNILTNTGAPMIALGPHVSNGQLIANVFNGDGVAWVTTDGNNFNFRGNIGSGSVDNGFLISGCGMKFRGSICELKRSNAYCIRALNTGSSCCVTADKSNISNGGQGLINGPVSKSCPGTVSGSSPGSGSGSGTGTGSDSETENPIPTPAFF